MDLMIVIPTFSGGGAEHVVRIIAEEIARQGRKCRIVGLYEPAGDTVAKSGVDYVGLGAPNFGSAVVRLTAHVRSTKPKAFLSTLKNACLATEIARRLAAPRAVHGIRVANSYAQEVARMSVTRKVIWRAAIAFMHRSASKTILVSQGLRDEVINLLPQIEDRAVVIHNPVEVASVSSVPAGPLPGASGARVLMVGRLAPQKDHLTALAAFALLGRRADLLIVGEGSLRDEIAARASALDIEDCVHLLGWRSDASALMKHCDLLLLTSRFEGFPNVLIEAMIAGIPIVATDCPHGPREIITDARIGELVPIGDTEAIAAAVSDRLNRSEDQTERDYRRTTALERYSLSEATTRYLEALAL